MLHHHPIPTLSPQDFEKGFFKKILCKKTDENIAFEIPDIGISKVSITLNVFRFLVCISPKGLHIPSPPLPHPIPLRF
jgi:hypothetical protein